MCMTDGNNVSWMLDFTRRLTDSEICALAILIDLLDRVSLLNREDEIPWDDGSKGFHVRLMVDLWTDKRRAKGNLRLPRFHYKRIWRTKYVPPKVAFFCWSVLCSRILTIDKLKSWGFQIINRYLFCKIHEDNIEHL